MVKSLEQTWKINERMTLNVKKTSGGLKMSHFHISIVLIASLTKLLGKYLIAIIEI